ncbi:hypothetical protein OH768_49115 [Streptomyces sp. NBC_01622]|nr:hypothetical protein OH768_49115 [Streptomyces sp. NBC_01622]
MRALVVAQPVDRRLRQRLLAACLLGCALLVATGLVVIALAWRHASRRP